MSCVPPATQERLVGSSAHWHPLNAVAYAPLDGFFGNNLVLATASRDELNQVKVWDLSRHKCLATIVHAKTHSQNFADFVTEVRFSPEGDKLLTSGQDNNIKMWDLAKLKSRKADKAPVLKTTFRGHKGCVDSVSFSPDSSIIASASWDGTIRLWETETGKLKEVFKAHNGHMHAVVFIAGGTKLLTCSDDRTAKIWLATGKATGKPFKLFMGHTGGVSSVAIDLASGDIIATASGDKTAKLWDIQTEKVLFTLTGHDNWVSGVDFSPNGRTLATCSYDCLAKLWSVERGECLHTFSGHNDIVTCIAFAPDGSTIATGSRDCAVQVWDVRRTVSEEVWEEVANMPETGEPPFQGHRYRPRRWGVCCGLMCSSCFWMVQKRARAGAKVATDKLEARREAKRIRAEKLARGEDVSAFKKSSVPLYEVGRVMECDYRNSGIYYPARIMLSEEDGRGKGGKYAVKFLQQGDIQREVPRAQIRVMAGSAQYEAKRRAPGAPTENEMAVEDIEEDSGTPVTSMSR